MNGNTGPTSIPLIDIAHFLSSTSSPAERHATAVKILSAFQNSGFLYITGHGISSSQIERVFHLSAWFFALPQASRDALPWDRPASNRGYSGFGQEKVSDELEKGDIDKIRAAMPDLKESLEIGKEGVEGMPNQWPNAGAEASSFRTEMLAFFDTCKDLHMQLMRALAVGLLGRLENERYFDGYTDGGDNTLRLLHYPPVNKSVFQINQGQVRAGAHTDYGSITLLFQDTRGGLQVKDGRSDGWVDVRPIDGTIVVNAGDLLARWSNGVVRSTLHRVVEPVDGSAMNDTNGSLDHGKKNETYPARYSVAYFCNPNFERLIDAIPGTVKEGEAKKFEAVNSGEYLEGRLAATYQSRN